MAPVRGPDLNPQDWVHDSLEHTSSLGFAKIANGIGDDYVEQGTLRCKGIDSTALFFFDSGSFILNALGLGFSSTPTAPSAVATQPLLTGPPKQVGSLDAPIPIGSNSLFRPDAFTGSIKHRLTSDASSCGSESADDGTMSRRAFQNESSGFNCPSLVEAVPVVGSNV